MKESVLVVREYDIFSEILAEANFEVVNFPAIQTTPIENLDELDEKLGEIENYDGLFLTSPKAAEVLLRRFHEKEFAFGGKVYVLGNRTKTLFENFENANFEIVFRENVNTAEELINSFERREFVGKKFLFLRGDKSLRTIPELLSGVAAIDEIVVYRTIENSFDKVLIDGIKQKLKQITWICFFSPSGIESYINAFGETSLGSVKIAAIGETTAGRAAEKKLKVDFISAKANAEDYARGLINRIKEIE